MKLFNLGMMATSQIGSTFVERLEALAAPRTRQVVGVLTFALLTALSSKVALPIPGTPVPFTFQPMLVMMAGAMLGARLGAASQIVYLAAGIAGLPVFALGSILAPSGGYLMAYPLAAFVVGSIVGGSLLRDFAGLLSGLAVIYAGGVAWLSLAIGAEGAFATGVAPFILPDVVKAVLALIVLRQIGRESRKLFGA